MARNGLSSAEGTSAADAFAVAIDIGGTKTAAGCVDRSGRLLERLSVPTVHDDAQALVDRVGDLVAELCRDQSGDPVAVGVSIAGAVDPSTGNVHYAPNIGTWRDVSLGRMLSGGTGLPTVVGFDGHMAAIGEHWVGAGRGTRNMVLLVVGTGIGGGLILDGKLYRGSDNLAGTAGWMIVDPATVDSDRARVKGHLESLSSGPALVAAANLLAASDRWQTAEDVLAAAEAGDEAARSAVERAGTFLAYAVTSIVSVLNPETVVLGGGLGSTGAFLDVVRDVSSAHAQPTSAQRVRFETALLGADAGLIGAARAAFERVDAPESGIVETRTKEVDARTP